MKIALTTDHTGLQLISPLKSFLESLGHECIYYGPTDFEAGDDYPDYIYPAAKAVASGECNKAIIIGGSGQGEAIVANRLSGVRCAVFYGPCLPVAPIDAEGREATDEYEILRLSRQHNDANMLSLAARFIDESTINKSVEIWLATEFSGADRHLRRINKIDERNQ